MEDKIHDKNILLVTYIKIFLIFFMLIIMPVAIVIYVNASAIYKLGYIIASIFLACIIYRMFNEWTNWVIWGKCDLESYRIYLEKILKMKRNRNNVNLHLSLLYSYLILGCYDECQKEINELSGLYSQMSDVQKLEYQLLHIDYLAALNGYSSLEKEIGEITELLNKTEKIHRNEKVRVQKSITIRKYLMEKKWKEVLNILNSAKVTTVFDEVYHSFISGLCYYKMGKYEQAFLEFDFVSKWGGNTKYVVLAKDIMTKFPDKDKYIKLEKKKTKKYNIEKIRIVGYLLISCFISIIIVLINYQSVYGNSIEEVYSRRYLCSESEVTILYQESIGDYELVILNENNKIAYCLFKKISQASEIKYRITNSFCTTKYVDDHETELERIEMIFSESEKERSQKFYQESEIEQGVWEVIIKFYKENKIFDQEDFTYVGVCYYPTVENITINGQHVNVEQINISNRDIVYLWRIENLDLNTNFQIDYVQ